MKLLKLLNDNLERYLMLVLLLGMTLVLGIQIVFLLCAQLSPDLVRRSWPASCHLEHLPEHRLLPQGGYFPEN